MLEQLLAAWRLEGWGETFGRYPNEEDLVVPYPPEQGEINGSTHWRSDTCRKRLDEDCKLLGFRHRRTHDSRRTLISLARSDGAREDVLKWATHGRPEGVFDSYTVTVQLRETANTDFLIDTVVKA
ncbi:MAG: hypothetical protein IH899_19945 [Planctomycetes bacterium]|nr:hypothetical protein [Planctomycetota bacterium]